MELYVSTLVEVDFNPPTHANTAITKSFRIGKRTRGIVVVVVLSSKPGHGHQDREKLPLPRFIFIVVITTTEVYHDSDAFLPVRIGHSKHNLAIKLGQNHENAHN